MARHPHAAAQSCWRSLTASSLSSSKSFPTNLLPTSLPFRSSSHRPVAAVLSHSLAIDAGSCSFTWDDVVQVSHPESAPNDTSDLRGFFDKIKFCNRGAETQNDFIRFFVDDQAVGYIHKSFCDSLRSYKDVFVFPYHRGDLYGYQAKLHPSLKRYDDRTRAVANVVRLLGEIKLIPGVRNELYPVTSSFGGSVFFSLERAAAPYFGIKAYGIHMNGYVEKNGQKFLWIGRRSQVKPTFPGMLDHLVAGGLPHGIPCGENLIKECEEEAGIPRSLSKSAIPVGAVSYVDINGPRYKRDVLFCYDLKLPEDFTPINQDGEVESFRLIPVEHVANVVKRTQFFKPNCSIVIIDFLFRHGYIKPEFSGYLDLLQNLKSGDCS